MARGLRTTFPITTPEQPKLSTEFEAALGSFVQNLIIAERVRYKKRWKNSGRDCAPEYCMSGIAMAWPKPIGRKACEQRLLNKFKQG